ncbi:MAG: hypothetical protein ACK5Y2_05730 [Bdellovibrionales bacterium]
MKSNIGYSKRQLLWGGLPITALLMILFQNCSPNVRFQETAARLASISVPSSAKGTLDFRCRNQTRNGAWSKQITVGYNEVYECEFTALSSAPRGNSVYTETNVSVEPSPILLGGPGRGGGWTGPDGARKYIFSATNVALETTPMASIVNDMTNAGVAASERVDFIFQSNGGVSSLAMPVTQPPPPGATCVANYQQACQPTTLVNWTGQTVSASGTVGAINCEGVCMPTACNTAQGYRFPIELYPGQIQQCFRCNELPTVRWGGADGLLSCGHYGNSTVFTDSSTTVNSGGPFVTDGFGQLPVVCQNNRLVPDSSRQTTCAVTYYFSNTYADSTHPAYRYAPNYDANLCATIHPTRCQLSQNSPPVGNSNWSVTCVCNSM